MSNSPDALLFVCSDGFYRDHRLWFIAIALPDREHGSVDSVVIEQRDPQSRQEAQTVPVGRFGQEGRLLGDYGCVKKVDHAGPELEGGTEPVYH